MKKVLVLAAAAFLFTGVAFASGDGKKCAKSKECTKDMKAHKDMKDCCKKEVAKTTTAKPAAKKA